MGYQNINHDVRVSLEVRLLVKLRPIYISEAHVAPGAYGHMYGPHQHHPLFMGGTAERRSGKHNMFYVRCGSYEPMAPVN